MRFAVYFAPEPSSLLHRLGSQWLGRDAFSGGSCIQPGPADLAEMTAEPRRYGFHATLKPPFALKEQLSAAALEAAVAAGGTLLKPGAAVEWGGYTGYFADPDGFLWEIAWNPDFPLREDGSIDLQ